MCRWQRGLDGYATLIRERLGVDLTESRFGDGALTWDKDSPHAGADLEALHETLFNAWPTWAIRRVADWGPPPRHLVPITLTPTQQSQYLMEWAAFKAATAKADLDYRKATTGKAKATAKAKGLAAQTRYRQKAGLLHAPAVIKDALEHLAQGQQVAVSCEFLDTAAAITDGLGKAGVEVATYTGANREEREGERRRFQTGQAKVIVFTPTAGFSLHAGEDAVGGNRVPRVLLVAEPRWAPIPMAQAEGRTHRDGEVSPAFYYYAKGTIEYDVLSRAIEGMGSQAVMMGQDRAAINAVAKALGVTRVW